VRPALNPRKFRRQGGRSPLEPPDSNVQYSVFAAPRWPLHPLLFPCVTAVALSSRYIRYFSHALQPLHSLAVAFSRGGWVFLPPARTGTSNCQCQWAPLPGSASQQQRFSAMQQPAPSSRRRLRNLTTQLDGSRHRKLPEPLSAAVGAAPMTIASVECIYTKPAWVR
jgi:hypothetical protein